MKREDAIFEIEKSVPLTNDFNGIMQAPVGSVFYRIPTHKVPAEEGVIILIKMMVGPETSLDRIKQAAVAITLPTTAERVSNAIQSLEILSAREVV